MIIYKKFSSTTHQVYYEIMEILGTVRNGIFLDRIRGIPIRRATAKPRRRSTHVPSRCHRFHIVPFSREIASCFMSSARIGPTTWESQPFCRCSFSSDPSASSKCTERRWYWKTATSWPRGSISASNTSRSTKSPTPTKRLHA